MQLGYMTCPESEKVIIANNFWLSSENEYVDICTCINA